ncbi:protein timeless-like [Myzus persicae]|uniref:protein timeless-like n=1 Tax=Myzus persicae TaxID=13164 RepID=UPI000B9372D6|nr:protein timeless-like [Myzus persicae]
MAYEGYKIAKQLSMAEQQKSDDVQIYVRQLYLVVMAIKEVVETIELYRKISVTPLTNIDLLQDLECNNSPESTTWKEDIKSLFSMLIHFYNSDLQTFEYLLDLIITNHKLILLLDNLDYWTSNDTTEHFKRFATADIMYKYGTVLQNYTKNDELVNDAILTLIRHVFGDCELNSVILQPIILETLLKITENDYNPCKKWRDLIERVLNLSKFRAICSAYAESRITRKIQKKI